MQKNSYEGRDRREFFRIRYPLNLRPSINLLHNNYEVIDISPKGVKLFCKKPHELTVGLAVKCTIVFHDGELLDLSGRILRIEENVVIIFLTEEVPFNRIMLEQRYIVDKYPDYFSKH